MKKEIARFFMAAWILGVVLTGCDRIQVVNDKAITTETSTIEPDGATSARVQIFMGAGELSLEGGAKNLMESSFSFNAEAFRPTVSYNVSDGVGKLVVSQDTESLPTGLQLVNQWTIALNDSIPIELEIETGVGENNLDLSTLNVMKTHVETGVGEVNINMNGEWSHDITVSVKGGVGAISIKLPKKMGVQVKVTSGLRGVTADGLALNGDTYTNDSFGESPQALYLQIEAGVGAIELVAR